MISATNFLSYQYWTITFTVRTNTSDKHFSDAISHNNKPIGLVSRRLSKSQHNVTMTKK